MDWQVVIANFPLLMSGLAKSVQLTLVSIVFSLPLGCLIAIGRLSHRRWLRGACTAFVNVLRSNPLILILFWFYFLVPLITGRNVNDLTSIIVAFIVFFAAYFTEIVRSGIQSVGAKQIQAGLSSGLTYAQTMRHIILPQAIRAMLPALITQCIVVFQGTTVVYIIGYSELLHTAVSIAERTVRPVELYVTVAAIYFVVCYGFSRVARYFEKEAV
ncbi:amino acid ABC transporter permease [Bosea sp. RAC05]|uniref:amino acid ABC transporter permease n=1 Tax=Bosea sp. RAC05 TaxID=1842539 RepID=UPI00083CAAE4|nr:amino acid ABC transporter permease [Bosea sp. RAC05]AOG07473.1 amino ABC transporter, permease, 3-TM region, His/Glu/Gln/Arg/opine family domain protein [Bosea sp. RAC05]